MLYPTTTMDISDLGDTEEIPSGSQLSVSFEVSESFLSLYVFQHISPTQDYSMRFWISQQVLYEFNLPGGQPIRGANDAPVSFNLVRSAILPLAIMTADRIQPARTFGVIVAPGLYFFNILNLINQNNTFSFATFPVE